jgi:hypothetical protein
VGCTRVLEVRGRVYYLASIPHASCAQGRTRGTVRWCGACGKAHPGARNLKVRRRIVVDQRCC